MALALYWNFRSESDNISSSLSPLGESKFQNSDRNQNRKFPSKVFLQNKGARSLYDFNEKKTEIYFLPIIKFKTYWCYFDFKIESMNTSFHHVICFSKSQIIPFQIFLLIRRNWYYQILQMNNDHGKWLLGKC